MLELCPNCFSEKSNYKVCPVCHYEFENANISSTALPVMTSLKGRYILGRTLGIGGFGITYLAYDTSKQIKCAVKEFMPSEIAVRDKSGNVYASNDDNQDVFEHCKDGFINEAKTLFAFSDDPTIVDVIDYFEAKNTAFLVMEFLDGCNMKAQLRNLGGKIPVEVATTMLVTIGSALMAVHKKNILHRDISPENIYFTKNGEYKLIDFGAARFFTSNENKSLSVLLKPGFAPPEQYSSKGNQGPWTDVYALAATFYYLVSGIKPVDTMDRLSGKEMPSLIEVCPLVSKQTSDAINHAMELNYKNRYQNVVSFMNDIDISCINSSPTSVPENKVISAVPPSEPAASKRKPRENTGIFKTIMMHREKERPKSSFQSNAIVKCFCGTNKEYDLEIEPNSQLKIGRANTSDIVIADDLNISRVHCILIFNGATKKFYIQDCSSNGTFLLNGMSVPHGVQMEITDGFYLSDTRNTFRIYLKE